MVSLSARLLVPVATVLLGCSPKVEVDGEVPRSDPTRRWLDLLEEATDDNGLLDYERVEEDRALLHRYLRYVGEHGPHSDDWGESKEKRRMAFMMNAYNAFAIEGVLRHRPLSSVLETGHVLDSVKPGMGFFLGQRFRIDGEWQSLYFLEHQDIVGHYQTPLAHVGLNCASRSCPPLRGWREKKLKTQLREAMEAWVQGDGLQCDLEDGGDTCRANAIFDWYRKDFLGWSSADTLCGYLVDYASGAEQEWLADHAEDCSLGFLDYDWSVNDVSAHSAGI